MKSKVKFIIFLCVIVVVIGGAALLYNSFSGDYAPEGSTVDTTNKDAETDEDEAPKAAPDFTVFDGEGNEVKLSDKKGKPVVLNFWASWCSPCKNEMPDFEEKFSEYSDRVEFMMVNVMSGDETTESAKKFISDSGYTFPIYFDTRQDAAAKYGVSSIPMTFFIDENGDFVAYAQGMLSKDNLQKGIDMLIGE